jgi:hypothetical protein
VKGHGFTLAEKLKWQVVLYQGASLLASLTQQDQYGALAPEGRCSIGSDDLCIQN